MHASTVEIMQALLLLFLGLDPLKSSPSSYCLLVSDSVGTTSSCSLLAFPLSVSLAPSHLRCLCFSISISKS